MAKKKTGKKATSKKKASKKKTKKKATSSSASGNLTEHKGYPPQAAYIVGNEACERFSFYGMKSILTVFMVQYLLFSEAHASEVVHLFVAFCYITPLLGAYLADRWFGRYKVILTLSLFYCLGHGTLALMDIPGVTGDLKEWILYIGLGLIAFGAGGIKPCVSAFVGDQFTKSNSHLISGIYQIFYFSINLGSTFATILIPWLLKTHGPAWAFGIPGVLMAIATFVFWLGRKQYRNLPPTGKDPDSVTSVLITGFTSKKKGGFWERAKKDHPAARVEGTRAVLGIIPIIVFASVFWALFDQTATSWILQAQNMNQDINLFGWSFQILPSQMQAANPIMVMAMIPLFAIFIYPALNKFYETTPLRRMGWGIALAGVSFFQVGYIQALMDGGQNVSILAQIIPYLTLTASEIMFSITGLEFCYTQAPKENKSTVMSLWFVGVFLGNLAVVAFIKSMSSGEGAKMATVGTFNFFGLLSIITAGLFAAYAMKYKMRNYVG